MTEIKKWLDAGQFLTFDGLRGERSLCADIQKVLISEGFLPRNANPNGLYGPITENALVNYKRKNGLSGGNNLGPTTFANLLSKQGSGSVSFGSSDALAAKVISVCKSRNIPLNDGVNIICLEGILPNGTKTDDAPDRWNDSIGILKYDGRSGTGKFLCIYTGTTEPGRYYTMNPMNKGGCARLDLGYHKGIWSKGLHRGYSALVQTGPARLVRDANKNFLRDDKVSVEYGNGVNLHTTRKGFFGNLVDRWSAGCVVIKDPNEFLNFLKILESNTTQRKDFDFVLIWRDWL